MAKNQNQAPLVTSVSTTLRKTLQSSTQVISDEEIKVKKKEMMGVIDDSLELFKKNLLEGKVTMTTSADLERIIKLQLLLSGEADSRVGKSTENETETTVQSAISMSKVEEILDIEDEEVKNMFNRLYEGYNKANDLDD